MAARSLGSGTISFGLVAIPIRLYPAAVSERVSFHLLHAKCGSRIKYQTYCPAGDQVVDRSDLVIGKGRYIRVTEDELEALELQLALRLIDELASEEFDPKKYDDEYRRRVLALVNEKAEGKEGTFAPPQAPRGKVIDLMDALKKSLAKRGGPEAAKKGSAGRKDLTKASRHAGEAPRPLEKRARVGKR